MQLLDRIDLADFDPSCLKNRLRRETVPVSTAAAACRGAYYI